MKSNKGSGAIEMFQGKVIVGKTQPGQEDIPSKPKSDLPKGVPSGKSKSKKGY